MGIQLPSRKWHSSPPLFGPCLLCPRSPISATAELLLANFLVYITTNYQLIEALVPIEYRRFWRSWLTLKVIQPFQPLYVWYFVDLCNSWPLPLLLHKAMTVSLTVIERKLTWQDFTWHRVLHVPSATDSSALCCNCQFWLLIVILLLLCWRVNVSIQIGEARALYNLGNICHARAKAVEQKAGNLSCCPADVQKVLLKAVEFYK